MLKDNYTSDTLVLPPPLEITQSQMRKMLTELNLDTEGCRQSVRLHRRYKLHYKAPYIHVYDPDEPERVARFLVQAMALAEFHGEVKLKNSPINKNIK